MTTRIRNAWAVLTGKADICAHAQGNYAYTFDWKGNHYVTVSPDLTGGTTMATPFRNLTLG